MNKFKIFLLFLMLSVFKAAGATTVTIDFESLKKVDTGYTFIAGSYVDSGYTFTASNSDPYSFASAGTLASRFAGSTALTTFNYGFVFLESNSGASFDLLAIDLAPVTLGLNDPFGIDREINLPYQTTIYGRKLDGSIVSQTIDLPNSSAANVLTTYSLLGFAGVTQVGIDSSAFPGVQFDNVVLQSTSAVPEPSIISCLILGLVLTAFLMKRSY
jgi:hypothetical protein